MQLKNRVEMAVAGSGKTWGICEEVINKIDLNNKKVLLVTYTNKGIESLKNTYMKQNLGVLNEKVEFKTWFQFLMSEFIKPYQNFITGKINYIKGFDFSKEYGYINYKSRGNLNHYVNSDRNVLSNYASEMSVDICAKSDRKPIKRLESIYSDIYIDEIQDLSGEDISILDLLFNSNINIKCVGDYKQSTYTTHNSKKNKKLTGKNIINYLREQEKNNIIELIYNNYTRRFGKDICDFANSIFPNSSDKIITKENSNLEIENTGVYIISKNDLKLYCEHYKPQALKYDSKTKTNYSALNFGQCKGMTFDRVLIYPNKVFENFIINNKEIESKSKYYVAATRARYSIVFVLEKIIENERFEKKKIMINDVTINVSKYKGEN